MPQSVSASTNTITYPEYREDEYIDYFLVYEPYLLVEMPYEDLGVKPVANSHKKISNKKNTSYVPVYEPDQPVQRKPINITNSQVNTIKNNQNVSKAQAVNKSQNKAINKNQTTNTNFFPVYDPYLNEYGPIANNKNKIKAITNNDQKKTINNNTDAAYFPVSYLDEPYLDEYDYFLVQMPIENQPKPIPVIKNKLNKSKPDPVAIGNNKNKSKTAGVNNNQNKAINKNKTTYYAVYEPGYESFMPVQLPLKAPRKPINVTNSQINNIKNNSELTIINKQNTYVADKKNSAISNQKKNNISNNHKLKISNKQSSN